MDMYIYAYLLTPFPGVVLKNVFHAEMVGTSRMVIYQIMHETKLSQFSRRHFYIDFLV